MMRFTTTGMSAVLAVLLAGCFRGGGNADLLEGRLREQEAYLAQLQSQLDGVRGELQVTRNEADALRAQLQEQGTPTLLPEQANVLYRVTGIRFNSLLTGGVDRDEQPGHDLLTTVIAPHDVDGELLKLPGDVVLTVIDPAADPSRQQIGRWEFGVEQTRELWYRGLIGSGYRFQLAWQERPRHAELVIHAQFTTPDGRAFDASQLVTIEPPDGPLDPGHSPNRSRPNERTIPSDPGPEPDLVPAPFDITDEQDARQVRYRPPRDEAAWQAPVLHESGGEPLDRGIPQQTSDRWTEAEIPRYR